MTPSLLIGTTNTARQPDLLDDDVVLIPTVVKATTQGEDLKILVCILCVSLVEFWVCVAFCLSFMNKESYS